MTCKVEGCPDTGKTVRGMCGMHYRRWKRGNLDKTRYARKKGSGGMNIHFPFEVRKINGLWHRRPTDSKEPWALVVWSDHAEMEDAA